MDLCLKGGPEFWPLLKRAVEAAERGQRAELKYDDDTVDIDGNGPIDEIRFVLIPTDDPPVGSAAWAIWTGEENEPPYDGWRD